MEIKSDKSGRISLVTTLIALGIVVLMTASIFAESKIAERNSDDAETSVDNVVDESVERTLTLELGETEDVGLGNALDKFARALGLGFPGGPKIEQLALQGKWTELPYTVKGMDVAFSGIITRVTQLANKGVSKEDLCYSLQEVFFSMITEVTERAMAHLRKKEVLLIGGVAANKRLCAMLEIMCKARGAKFFAVPMQYAGDNAAMIAWQGLLEYHAGRRETTLDIYPFERCDDIDVIWETAKAPLSK